MTTGTPEAAHTTSGTHYGADGQKAYGINRHGPDGALFLDGVFLPYIASGRVIDIGTGMGPWAVYAAQRGARVFASDYQEGMVRGARNAAIDAKVADIVHIYAANGAQLPHPASIFDQALSINVGCNLPTGVFEGHFREMERVLVRGCQAIVTAPANFGTVFTSGNKPEEQIQEEIDQALIEIGISDNPENIRRALNGLNDVYRATFAFRNGILSLITEESELISGEVIWRKLPGLTVPNRYHSRKEYINAANEAGLNLEHLHEAAFLDEEERKKYNRQVPVEKRLGFEYVNRSPFSVFVLKKT